MLIFKDRKWYRLSKFLTLMVLIIISPASSVLGIWVSTAAKQVDALRVMNEITSDPVIEVRGDSEFATLASTEGWKGTGTKADPYIIEGYTINGSGYSTCVRISYVNYRFILRNNTFYGADNETDAYWRSSHVRFTRVNCRVENNRFIGNETANGLVYYQSTVEVNNNEFWADSRGIWAWDSSSKIENNTFYGNRSSAMYISDGYADIRNNTFKEYLYASTAIEFYDVIEANVTGNIITGYSTAFESESDRNKPNAIRLVNNTLHNTTHGIEFDKGNNILIESNIITGDYISRLDWRGIYIRRAENLTARNNTLINCGFYVTDYFTYDDGSGNWKDYLIDISNTVNYGRVYFVKDTSNITVTNTFTELMMVNCSNVTISNLTMPKGFFGITADLSSKIMIVNNTYRTENESLYYFIQSRNFNFSDNKGVNRANIYSYSSDYATVCNNTLNSSILDAPYTDHIDVSNNTFLNSTVQRTLEFQGNRQVVIIGNNLTFIAERAYASAIYFNSCTRVIIKGNQVWNGGGFDVQLCGRSFFETLVYDGTNSLDGKKVYFATNSGWIKITKDCGQIIVGNCTLVTIDGLSFNRSNYGIQILYCLQTTISNCTFKNSQWYSMGIKSSPLTVIEYNCMIGGDGRIEITSSDEVTIKGNYLGEMKEEWLDSSDATVELTGCYDVQFLKNRIWNVSCDGLLIYRTERSEFKYNEFENCTRYAIDCQWSKNKFQFNNFVNNNRYENGTYRSSQCYDRIGQNVWNGSKYGNFWSDYTTRYPNANNDGYMWDIPYEIAGLSPRYDYRPLIRWYDYLPPYIPPIDDVHIDQHDIVQFNTTAVDNVAITNYTWSFIYGGRAQTLFGNSNSFKFNLAGEYLVTLTVRDYWNNSAMSNFAVFVHDIEPPVLPFMDNMTISQETNVVFNGSGCTDNVGVTVMNWSFIYNMTEVVLTGNLTNFTFVIPGTYMVTVNATDAEGNCNTTTFWIRVLDTERPVARIGDDTVIDQGTVLALSAWNSTDNVGIVTYNWTISSNRTGIVHLTGVNVTFNFTVPGLYTVHINVSDAAGNFATGSVTIEVRDTEPPMADAGGDITVEQRVSVHFNGSRSHDNSEIVTWSWTIVLEDFVLNLTGQNPRHAFEVAGTYTVYLSVWDAAGHRGDDRIKLTVLDIDPPTVVAGDDLTVDQHTEVTFNGSDSTDNTFIVQWIWTVMDGLDEIILDGPVVSYVFNDAGVFNVTFTVIDGRSNAASQTLVVTVRDTTPPACIPSEDLTIDQHEVLHIDGSCCSDNVGIAEWNWTMVPDSGGYPRDDVNFTHRFDDVGVFVINLTVKDAAGHSASARFNVTVRDVDPPSANAGPDLDVGQHVEASFNGSGSSDNVGVIGWTWTFEHNGKQVVLHGMNPVYTFDNPGEYTVILNVSDARGNWAVDDLKVRVRDTEDPIAIISFDGLKNESSVGQIVHLNGSRSSDNVGIVRWAWRIIIDNGTDPIELEGVSTNLRLERAGAYTVHLEVYDAEGLRGSDEATFTVKKARTEEDDTNIWPWVIVALVIVVVIGLVLISGIVRRKKEGIDDQ